MKKRKTSKGFTLVELIVVLVILAILIALLVPALTGYIDKANQKAAMTECRQVVVATQTTASELYGKDDFSLFNMNDLQKNILKLAEVDGTINNWTFTDPSTVDTLLYTSKKGTIVKYENKTYTIVEINSFMGSAKGISSLSQILNDTKDMTPSKDKNNKSRVLQDYLVKANSGKLPGLNDKEKALYTKLGIKNVNLDTVMWKPICASNGNIFLVAHSHNTDPYGAAYGYIIYYNEQYYVHTNGKNYSDIWIDDKGSPTTPDTDDNWKPISL